MLIIHIFVAANKFMKDSTAKHNKHRAINIELYWYYIQLVSKLYPDTT